MKINVHLIAKYIHKVVLWPLLISKGPHYDLWIYSGE